MGMPAFEGVTITRLEFKKAICFLEYSCNTVNTNVLPYTGLVIPAVVGYDIDTNGMAGKGMHSKLYDILQQSIEMELKVGNLYLIFHEHLEKDAAFWWKLMLEEKHHAALLQSGMDFFHNMDDFPRDLLPDSLEGIRNTNHKLSSMIEKYNLVPPAREEAFNIAYILETSAGELHFQSFLDREDLDEGGRLFQKLNRDDADHARRIHEYMEQNAIRFFDTHSF